MEADISEVTVVGAGLAGMTTALALAQRGLSARLVEAEPVLGGMCATRIIDGYPEDHGFHILQPWYRNVLRLVDELGIQRNFVDCPNYFQLMAGEFPRLRNFRALFTLRDLVGDIRSGVTPAPDRLIFYYLMVDLLSQRFGAGRRARRDIPVAEFLRTRWYLTEIARRELEHVVVTASAWDFETASTETFRAGIAASASYRQHIRMPRDTLDRTLIQPFRDRLESLGVTVRTGCELVSIEIDRGRVGRIGLREAGRTESTAVDQLVLAIPPGRLASLGDDLAAVLVPPGGPGRLVARPLGALHVHLSTTLTGLPAEHVRLVGSRYAISLIDVARAWGRPGGSVLNCVIGRVGRLAGVAPAESVDALLDELMRYLPVLRREDISHICYQPHFAEPFFLADVDSWRYRPGAGTRLANLHLAGDFCALPAGAAAMEAAVMSGLLAAESVRNAIGLAGPPVEVLPLRTVNPRLAAVARVALAPVALAARLAARRTAADNRAIDHAEVG